MPSYGVAFQNAQYIMCSSLGESMSLIVSEVYEALIEAGASKEKARAAAGAIPHVERLATKEDVARLAAVTKEDIARLAVVTKEDIAELGKSIRAEIARVDQSTKAEIARVETSTRADIAKLDKSVAVLKWAVFTFQPTILAIVVKLLFFP